MLALAGCGGSFAPSPNEELPPGTDAGNDAGTDASVAPPLACVPLALLNYRAETSCTSAIGKESCEAGGASRLDVDAVNGSLLAVASNDPAAGGADAPKFGVANMTFVPPGEPRRLSMKYALSLRERSDATMSARVGCFLEWSGSDRYNVLIPRVGRDGRFAAQYTRNNQPGHAAESVVLGQAAPWDGRTLQVELDVVAGRDASTVSVRIFRSQTTYLQGSWSGQPLLSNGDVLPGFDPTQVRIFCGTTVEDGDGTAMLSTVFVSEVSGEICYLEGDVPEIVPPPDPVEPADAGTAEPAPDADLALAP